MIPLDLSTPGITDTGQVCTLLGSLGFSHLAHQLKSYDRSDAAFAVNAMDVLGCVLKWESKRREEELKVCRRREACLPYLGARLQDSRNNFGESLRHQLLHDMEPFFSLPKVIVTGPVQTGKTYLACAIANVYIDHGKTVRFESAPAFFEDLLKNGQQVTLENTWSFIIAYDLFILDDMEMVDLTPQTARLLQKLLEYRKSRQTMFISAVPTNLWSDDGRDEPSVYCVLKRLVHDAFQIHLEQYDHSAFSLSEEFMIDEDFLISEDELPF